MADDSSPLLELSRTLGNAHLHVTSRPPRENTCGFSEIYGCVLIFPTPRPGLAPKGLSHEYIHYLSLHSHAQALSALNSSLNRQTSLMPRGEAGQANQVSQSGPLSHLNLCTKHEDQDSEKKKEETRQVFMVVHLIFNSFPPWAQNFA